MKRLRPTVLLRGALTALLTLANPFAEGNAHAASGTWTNLVAGSWSAGTNWLNGIVPNAVGDTAAISADITAARTITLDGNRTLGALSLGDPGNGSGSYSGYTIATGSVANAQIVFNNGGGGATLNFPVATALNVNLISAGITLNDNLTLNVSTISGASLNSLNGIITDGAGNFSLTQNGPGWTSFGGANNYRGGTTINGGRIAVTNAAGFGYGPVTVNAGGAMCINGAVTVTNGLSLNGIGVTETAGNLGALRLVAGVASGPITLAGDTRIVAQASTGFLRGNIGESGGSRALELANYNVTGGTSTLTVSGTNSYSGDTTIKGCYLIVTNTPSAFGSGGTVTVVDNTRAASITQLQLRGVTLSNNIVLNSTAQANFQGALCGAGNNLISTVLGSVTILTNVGNGGHLASVSGQNHVLRITGPILTPTGITPVVRVGIVELSGGGTYANLGVGEGLLRIGANNGLNPTAKLSLATAAAATFDLQGFSQTLAGLTQAAASACFVTNSSASLSTLTLNPSGVCTYAGTLTGNLGLNVASGQFVLTGFANDYGGPTLVSGGALYVNGYHTGAGTVTAASGGTLGGIGSVTAPVVVSTGGNLEAGYGGAGTLTTPGITFGSGASDVTTSLVNVAGGAKIVSTGTVTVNGTNRIDVVGVAPAVGAYDLIGYSGATPFAGMKLGSLPYGVFGYLQDSGLAIQLNVTNVVIEPGVWVGNVSATWNRTNSLDWKGVNSGLPQAYRDGYPVTFDESSTNLTVALGTNVVPGGVTVSGPNDYTFTGSGFISGLAGLTNAGPGQLSLLTSNTYSGLTVITWDGRVKVGNGSTNGALGTGSIVNDGQLVFNRSDTVTLAVEQSGSGLMEQRGPGTLVLAGNNAYYGGTLVSGGRLQVGVRNGLVTQGSVSGAIINNSTLGFYSIDASSTAVGNILSGTGALFFEGPGDLLSRGYFNLGADNSGFTGTVLITNTSVRVNAELQLGYPSLVTVYSNGAAYFQGGSLYTNAFRLAGDGWIDTDGTRRGALRVGNTLELSGPVTIAGKTRVSVDSSFVATLSGPWSGTAPLELKLSIATCIFTGDSSGFTGPLTLSSGYCYVHGTLGAANTTVMLGGLLGGTGTIAGTITNNGALSAGGASVGTLTTGSEVWNLSSGVRVKMTNASTAGGWDTLNINGTLDIQALSSSPITINPRSQLVDGTAGGMEGFVNTTNYSWPIATASGGILNFAANKFTVSTNNLLNDTTGGRFSVSVVGNTLMLNYIYGSANADLATLALAPAGTLAPPFDASTLTYAASEAYTNSPLTVTATAADPTATIQVICAGVTNPMVTLDANPGVANAIHVVVTAQDNVTRKDYVVNVTRQPSLTRPTIGTLVTPGAMTVSWPQDHTGWHLETQTNSLSVGLGSNWLAWPGSDATNAVSLPIDPSNPAVFLRLTFP